MVSLYDYVLSSNSAPHWAPTLWVHHYLHGPENWHIGHKIRYMCTVLISIDIQVFTTLMNQTVSNICIIYNSPRKEIKVLCFAINIITFLFLELAVYPPASLLVYPIVVLHVYYIVLRHSVCFSNV